MMKFAIRYRFGQEGCCRIRRLISGATCAGDWYGQPMADLADLSPDRYAPLMAPILERLTFAVVKLSVSRAPSVPATGGASADAMRMFAQLRTALSARAISPGGIEAGYRYRDTDDVRDDLGGLRGAGLIEASPDGTIRATETGRAVLAMMYQTSAEATGQLWSQNENALPALNDLAGRVIHAGLSTGGDAYLTMAPPYEPADATVGVLLHNRLSVLR